VKREEPVAALAVNRLSCSKAFADDSAVSRIGIG